MSERTVTAKAALIPAVARLREAGIEDPARDARILLAHAMGLAADRLTLHITDALSPAQERHFHEMIDQRLQHRPVSKIIGHRQFWGLDFIVSDAVLDPRPETEILVAEALSEPFSSIVDLGTGSGCILLACLHGMPGATGLGADYMAAALELAEVNATRLGLGARAEFCSCDWREEAWWSKGGFDLVVSNPPYIAADEMPGLAPEVLLWDPEIALSPGGDGLDAYRAISAQLPQMLTPGGRVLFEIGPTQAAAVSDLLRAAGLTEIRVLRDFDGRDRVVAGRRA